MSRHPSPHYVIGPIFLFLILLLINGLAHASSPIKLQLRWHHQFQFAGYYAAQYKGFYQEKGLTVEIIEGDPNHTPIEAVLNGHAQYGIANNELISHYLLGDPLKLLAAVGQHSPSVLLTRKDSGIRPPQDLIGKKVMMVGGVKNVDYLTMLTHEGVNLKDITLVPSSYNLEDLISGKVDAFGAYLTNEPNRMLEQGIEPYSIRPLDYGVDFYSDMLFTSQEEVQRHPKRVKAFLAASLKGWEYAMAHPDEVIQYILQHYQTKTSVDHLRFEAQSYQDLILPTLIPIGNINPGRIQHMADMIQTFSSVPMAQTDTTRLIYDPNPKVDKSIFLESLGLVAAIAVIAFGFAFWFWNLTCRLKLEIQKRELFETALQESESHFRSIVSHLQDVYYQADLSGTIISMSPSVEKLIGLPAKEMIGRKLADFYLPPFKREDFLKAMIDHQGKLEGYEIKILIPEDKVRWISVNSQYFLQNGEVVGVEGTIRDITDLKERQNEMRLLAFEDPLTGLPNRRALIEQLVKAISSANRHGNHGALLFIDLDEFKPINDTYGHAMGDKLLQAVAERLKQHLRLEDTIYRIGGDEFIALLPRLDIQVNTLDDCLYAAAHKILENLTQPFLIDQQVLSISASIGAAHFPQPNKDADALIQLADDAMYRAKHDGKGQCFIVQPENK